ncbi:DNA-binding protein [Dentipellis sp. KUC8613]|nr:DNA-binding protein [Dentipellis sp. KUC8613]
MQAQAHKRVQEALSAQQSLATVQTLLRAGLGCIAYLRDLLPQENFAESFLTSSSDGTISSQSSDAGLLTSANDNGRRRGVSGFRVMTVSRGWSAEADKILDYLENGIFDAIEKQYLRSFIFAIYLDDQDPNNIVEAYTFNFKYHTIPGTDTVVPIMSLGEDLMRMSLNGQKPAGDPVAEATRQGKAPTLGEVKLSLKTLIKTLIQAITNMDRLPKRRFATFKIHYYPHTPASYEPPNFCAGDAEKDQWYFTTHGKKEAPEKWSIGKLETGWHGVDVHVASVSGIIPPTDDNSAPFSGTTSSPHPTATYDTTSRKAEIEVQKRDAAERTVVWDADNLGRMDSRDVDAEGEVDPEYIPDEADDSGVGLDVWVPLGVRNEDGEIIPLSREQQVAERREHMQGSGGDMDVDGGNTQELLFGGTTESIPSCVGHLNDKGQEDMDQDFSQTQKIVATQVAESSSQLPPPTSPISTSSSILHPLPVASESPVTSSPLPPSDINPCSFMSTTSRGIDTQMVIDAVENSTRRLSGPIEEEMLDMETQVIPTFEDSMRTPTRPTTQTTANAATRASTSHCTVRKQGTANTSTTEEKLNCDCGVCIEDCPLLFCEGGCETWYHIWCMGFHSESDARLPQKFTCFHCHLRNDQNWEIIVLQPWYQDMLSKYGQLALFRRAIKIAENEEPGTSKEFAGLIGCEALVAGQLFKRLETEGFIAAASDHEGIAAPPPARVKGGKGKGKQKQRKNIKKAVYAFVAAARRGKAYADYFTPDRTVEMRVMGLEDLVSMGGLPQGAVVRASKKVKISLVAPVDLYD